VPTNTAGRDVTYRVAGEHEREGMVEKAGRLIDIEVAEADYHSAVETSTVKSNHSSASVAIPVGGNTMTVGAGGGSAHGESVTHRHGVSEAPEVRFKTTEDATLKGHSMNADVLNAEIGGDLRIETPQDRRIYDGASLHASVTIPTSQDAQDNSTTEGPSLAEWISNPSSSASAIGDQLTGNAPDNHRPGLDSLGGSFQRERTKQATAASGLFGGTSAKVTVGGKTTLIGGVVGASSPDALEFSTGSLETQDLDNRSESIGLGGTLSFKSDGKGGTKPVLSGDFSKSDKESTTHATVTEGKVEVDGVEVTELPSVNRNITRIEEIKKDESYGVRIYIPTENVVDTINEVKGQVIDTVSAINAAVQEIRKNPALRNEKELQAKAAVTEEVLQNLSQAQEFQILSEEKQVALVDKAAELKYISNNLEKVQKSRAQRGQELTAEDMAMIYSGAAVETTANGISYKEVAQLRLGVATGEKGGFDFNFIRHAVEAKQSAMHNAAATAKATLEWVMEHPWAFTATNYAVNIGVGLATAGPAGGIAGGGVATKNEATGAAIDYALGKEIAAGILYVAEKQAKVFKKLEPTYSDDEAFHMGMSAALLTGAGAAALAGVGGKVIHKALKTALAERAASKAATRIARGVVKAGEQASGSLVYSEPAASTIIGRKGQVLKFPHLDNKPTTVNGLDYSGHAIDQMQRRGVMPSMVEYVVKNYTPVKGKKADTIEYYDPVNKLKVVKGVTSGEIVTVIHGRE
jgi:hypothetical protein